MFFVRIFDYLSLFYSAPTVATGDFAFLLCLGRTTAMPAILSASQTIWRRCSATTFLVWPWLLRRGLRSLIFLPSFFFSPGVLSVRSVSSLRQWHVNIQGHPTQFGFGTTAFHFIFKFTSMYPFECPQVFATTPLPHPSVDRASRRVCLQMLEPIKDSALIGAAYAGWSPVFDASALLRQLQLLLISTEWADTPADTLHEMARAAAEFKCEDPNCRHQSGNAWPPVLSPFPAAPILHSPRTDQGSCSSIDQDACTRESQAVVTTPTHSQLLHLAQSPARLFGEHALPHELMLLMLVFLSPGDVASLMCVSKDSWRVGLDCRLWARLFALEYGQSRLQVEHHSQMNCSYNRVCMSSQAMHAGEWRFIFMLEQRSALADLQCFLTKNLLCVNPGPNYPHNPTKVLRGRTGHSPDDRGGQALQPHFIRAQQLRPRVF